MATTLCSICQEETSTFICTGCSKSFCFEHLTEHRQLLNEQFHIIQDEFNQLKQIIVEIKNNHQKHPLIEQVNQWEINSINQIKQKAKESRQILINYTNQIIDEIEMKLNETNQQFISNNKKKNDFNEIHLNQLKDKLEILQEELNQPKALSIKQQSNSFIQEISIQFRCKELCISNLNINQSWKQNGTTVVGGHGQGNELNQFNRPCGWFIDDDDQTIYVADTYNHRIVEWKRNAINGRIVAGGNDQGDRNDQLNYPRKVIVDKENDSLIISDASNRRVMRWPRRIGRNGRTGEILISNIGCHDLIMDDRGYLYVSDIWKHEVRRWKIGETNGTIVAGGNGRGNRLDQLNGPLYIFIDKDYSLYVSDRDNHRVMKWMKGAKEGIVVAGGQGQGNSLRQLSNPWGIIVDQLGSVYVADSWNDRVIRWLKGAQEGSIVVGGNGNGEQPNQLSRPIDLSFDRENNLYVLEWLRNRAQKFDFIGKL